MWRMIRSIVADLAERIDECDDGGRAVALYSENRHDWVLMDINLKKTSGIDATREIVSAFREAKIVIVTNYDDEHFRESARQAGACGYILKENLLDVRRLLKG